MHDMTNPLTLDTLLRAKAALTDTDKANRLYIDPKQYKGLPISLIYGLARKDKEGRWYFELI